MRKFTYLLFISIVIALPLNKMSGSDVELPKFSTESFFIKTKSPLRISEATGKISLNSGSISFDKKLAEYNAYSIERVFEIYNGDIDVYSELEMDRIYVVNIEKSDFGLVENIVVDFMSEDIVEYAEPNFYGEAAGVRGNSNEFFPNDKYFYKQWYLYNDGSISSSSRVNSTPGADINMPKAWEIETGSDKVIVAILDSGIRDDHPDIKNRMWVNKNEIPNNGIDDDRNGYVDDYNGWDFAYDTKDNYDGFGHGTNIASVIGAETDNSIGFAGIDQHAKLMNCKNLSDDNYGEYIWWSRSIKYAVDNGANIINMSEGGDDYSRVLKTAVDYAHAKGILIVASMMNKGDGKDYYPASFEGVLAVGATDTDDSRCLRFTWGGGSCYGNHIGVVAPGNKIYGLDYEDINNYDVYWSGTSQSTAIVSGLASLLYAQDNNRRRLDLIDVITKTARDMVGDPREDKPGWDKYYGHGRVDAYLALLYKSNPQLALQLKNENLRSSSIENRKEVVPEIKNERARARDSERDSRSKPDQRDRRIKPEPAKK